MNNTFIPLLKTNLKLLFDFRGKRQKASMLSIFFVVLIAGMAFAALYSFIFIMAAIEGGTPIGSVLYAMAGFASLLALTTTIPKVKSTLFGGNDYDMLAALPIPKREIIFVKFLGLYLVEFFYSVIILAPSGIMCFIFEQDINYIIQTLIMIFSVPIFPLLLACFVGTFISIISDRSKFGNIISMFFYGIFLVVIMASSFAASSGSTDSLEPMFNTFKWFNPTNELLKINIPILNYVCYMSVNLLLLIIIVIPLTWFYDHIHDLLISSRTKKKINLKQEIKVNNRSKSLLKLEFKKYFNSKGYLMNTITGGIMCVVLVILMLASFLTNENKDFILVIKDIMPYLSLMIMWCVGLSTPAGSAISIEGKNFWIIKTLPIDYKQYLKSKILLSELVLAPFALIASIILIAFSNITIEGVIVTLLLPQLYLLSINYISLVINTRFYKLSWSNEMEVVKNSKAIIFIMLIDFTYTIVVAAIFILLGVLVDLLIATIVVLLFELIMVIISRTTLYKKGPARIAEMEV